jgi:hypothetical protein
MSLVLSVHSLDEQLLFDRKPLGQRSLARGNEISQLIPPQILESRFSAQVNANFIIGRTCATLITMTEVLKRIKNNSLSLVYLINIIAVYEEFYVDSNTILIRSQEEFDELRYQMYEETIVIALCDLEFEEATLYALYTTHSIKCKRLTVNTLISFENVDVGFLDLRLSCRIFGNLTSECTISATNILYASLILGEVNIVKNHSLIYFSKNYEKEALLTAPSALIDENNNPTFMVTLFAPGIENFPQMYEYKPEPETFKVDSESPVLYS